VRRELVLHGHDLAEKPELVAISKCELTGSDDVRARLEKELGKEVLAISAVTGQGLSKLVSGVVRQLRSLGEEVAR
jgi:GTP-binding protein